MNVIFDTNYLYHKTFNVFRTYYKHIGTMAELFSDKERVNQFKRKVVIDMCFALRLFDEVDKVIFVFDSQSWRTLIHDDYKYKTSTQRNEDYTIFFDLLKSFEFELQKKGFVTHSEKGMEGDDLLYFWSKYFTDNKKFCTIITGDGDLKQLVSPWVFLLNNNSKNFTLSYFQNGDYLDPVFINNQACTSKPTNPNYELYKKVFLGDDGDNVPKVLKGFGEKGFEKFWDMVDKEITDHSNLEQSAHLLSNAFSIYNGSDDFDRHRHNRFEEAIEYNLRLVWLNELIIPYEYNEQVFKEKLNSYKYKKPFTLEYYYNLPIK